MRANEQVNLSEVKSKKSYRRDVDFTVHLKRILGVATKVQAITAGTIEGYQNLRMSEASPRRKGKNTAPATVNKGVSCLNTMFNRAIRYGKLRENPVGKVKKLIENNVRMKILSVEEFEELYVQCSSYLKPVVLMAYFTGMRRSEILNLIWEDVDLKKGFVRLKAESTKTQTARSMPLHPKVVSTLKSLSMSESSSKVFLRNGMPFVDIKKGFKAACCRAGIEDFTFHDLRHCALNNMRLAGKDYFRIMAASGHKTTAVFKRYNLVTEEELSQMKWLDG